jgi:hypothetical protein
VHALWGQTTTRGSAPRRSFLVDSRCGRIKEHYLGVKTPGKCQDFNEKQNVGTLNGGKPDPDLFLTGAERVGSEIETASVVGDSVRWQDHQHDGFGTDRQSGSLATEDPGGAKTKGRDTSSEIEFAQGEPDAGKGL